MARIQNRRNGWVRCRFMTFKNAPEQNPGIEVVGVFLPVGAIGYCSKDWPRIEVAYRDD